MTFFYPMGNMSPWSDNELRYSLRSFQQHITRVVLIGHKPKWYTGEHYDFPIGTWSKPEDIWRKTAAMCKLADTFIFTNDDHFLLSPITDIPNYYSGTLKGFNRGSQTFMRYVDKTRQLFPDGLYYDIHTPLIIDAEKFLQLRYTRETVLKSVYCNTFQGPSMQLDDLKINHHVRTEEINRLVDGRQFMSVGDNGLSADMKNWLRNRFPDPSPWELAEFGNIKRKY